MPERAGTQEPTARRRDGLVTLLTLSTGATDVAIFMRFGHVFASVMTGNIVLLGLGVAQGEVSLEVHAGVALLGYICGAALGTVIARATGPAGQNWKTGTTIAFCAELGLLAALSAGWEITGGTPGGKVQLLMLAVAALAMGTQSGTVRQLGVPGLSTTYLTGTLTGLVAGLITREHGDIGRSVALLVTLGVGAGVGGVLVAEAPRFVPVLWLAPLAVVIVGGSGGTRRRAAS